MIRLPDYYRTRFLKNVLGILAMLLGVSVLTAQEVLPGKTITSDETWRGTIRLKGDVMIAPDVRLLIEPGTRILFAPDVDEQRSGMDKTRAEIIVRGMLIARGTIDNKITFSVDSPSPRMGNWYGISISNPEKKSLLDYVVVEYAHNGISIKNSNPSITNSNLRFNYNAGVLAEVRARPLLTRNVISENGYGGVICNLGARPVLSENLITANQIGVINFRLSQPNLGSMLRNDDYNIGQNRIFDNYEYNIYNHSNLPVKAENNFWGVLNRQDVEVTIYDANEDSQYGAVDFEPYNRVRSDLEPFVETTRETRPVLPSQPVATAQRADTIREEAVTDTVEELLAQADNPTVENDGAESETETVSNPPATPVSGADPAVRNPAEIPAESIAEAAERRLQEPADSGPSVPVADKKEEKPQINYDQIFLEAFLDEKPVATEKQVPKIDGLRGLGAKGLVQVRIVVGKNGRVESAQVLRGLNPYCDRISRETAERFRFKPGTIQGKNVRFSTNLFFEF